MEIYGGLLIAKELCGEIPLTVTIIRHHAGEVTLELAAKGAFPCHVRAYIAKECAICDPFAVEEHAQVVTLHISDYDVADWLELLRAIPEVVTLELLDLPLERWEHEASERESRALFLEECVFEDTGESPNDEERYRQEDFQPEVQNG